MCIPAAAFTFIALVPNVFDAVGQQQLKNYLDVEGVLIDATMVERDDGGRADPGPYIKFQFVVRAGSERRIITKKQRISGESYAAWHVNDEIVIYYDPNDPQRALIYDSERDLIAVHMLEALWGYIIGAWLLNLVAAIGYLSWLVYNERTWAGLDQVLYGEITGSEGYWSKIKLDYRFTTPQNNVIHSNVQIKRDFFKNRAIPQAGTKVAIHYYADKRYFIL